MATIETKHNHDALLDKLADLAAEWAETQEQQLVDEYCHTLLSLMENGWDDVIDLDASLPPELMPQEYTKRFNS